MQAFQCILEPGMAEIFLTVSSIDGILFYNCFRDGDLWTSFHECCFVAREELDVAD
jgi:hypothetical protein